MISKDAFVEAMIMVKKQAEIDKKVEEAIDLVSGGCNNFGIHNLNQVALIMVLTEIFDDEDEWIAWWLFEPVHHVAPLTDEDGFEGEIVDVENPADFYDFLLKEKEMREKLRNKELYQKNKGDTDDGKSNT